MEKQKQEHSLSVTELSVAIAYLALTLAVKLFDVFSRHRRSETAPQPEAEASGRASSQTTIELPWPGP